MVSIQLCTHSVNFHTKKYRILKVQSLTLVATTIPCFSQPFHPFPPENPPSLYRSPTWRKFPPLQGFPPWGFSKPRKVAIKRLWKGIKLGLFELVMPLLITFLSRWFGHGTISQKTGFLPKMVTQFGKNMPKKWKAFSLFSTPT